MQIHLDDGTGPWGVKVERVEMYVLFEIAMMNMFLF
jgi:hypothetical protein